MDRVQQVRYEAYDPAKARHRRQQSAQQLQTQAGSSGSNASSVSSPPAASPSTSRSGSAAQLRTLGNGSPQSAGTGAARGAGAAPSAVRRLGSSSSSSAAPASAAAATAAAAGDAPDTPSTPSKTSNNGIRVFVDGHSTPEYPRSATASPARVASPVGGATSPPPPGPSASSSYSSEAQGPSPRTSRPSTPVSYAQTGPAPATPPKPYQQGQSRGESPSASAAPSRTPYHARFQPPGVRRDRTDEFLTLRKAKGESKKLEDGRLARRLEKVRVALALRSLRRSDASLCTDPTAGRFTLPTARAHPRRSIRVSSDGWREREGWQRRSSLTRPSKRAADCSDAQRLWRRAQRQVACRVLEGGGERKRRDRQRYGAALRLLLLAAAETSMVRPSQMPNSQSCDGRTMRRPRTVQSAGASRTAPLNAHLLMLVARMLFSAQRAVWLAHAPASLSTLRPRRLLPPTFLQQCIEGGSRGASRLARPARATRTMLDVHHVRVRRGGCSFHGAVCSRV